MEILEMVIETPIPRFVLREANEKDVPLILSFIKHLAEYEKLSHQVIATEDSLQKSLFGERRFAEVILGYYQDQPVAFALFFHNYSTFLGKPGIYLEDLFVKPDMRGKGFGKTMLAYLARLAKERDCGRLEWWVLDWNEAALEFYRALGATPMKEWIVQRLTESDLDKVAREFG